jgi:transcription elongation factor GreA
MHPKIIPFTKAGYEKLEKDYESLMEKRKEVLVRLQAAREMGDLSENAAYKGARLELGSIDRQLNHLRRLIHFGQVVEIKKKDTADFGAKITLDDGHQKLTFTLVGSYESDPGKSKLSADSPIGKAVVGKKIGSKVTINAPSGQKTFTLISLKY